MGSKGLPTRPIKKKKEILTRHASITQSIAGNIKIFIFWREEHLKYLKTCCEPYLGLYIHLFCLLSHGPVPLSEGSLTVENGIVGLLICIFCISPTYVCPQLEWRDSSFCLTFYGSLLSRKVKSRYGIDSGNSVWNWVAKLYRLTGRYDNPMPTWCLAPIAGLKGTQAWEFFGLRYRN
jgi:hypothetical protein